MKRATLAVDRMNANQLWKALDTRLIYLEPGTRRAPTFAGQRLLWLEARSIATELRLRGTQLQLPLLDDEEISRT